MALKPHSRVTRRLLAGSTALIPFALLYAALLATSWRKGSLALLLPGSFEEGVASMRLGRLSAQFLPTLATVQELLAAPLPALAAWAHLQFVAFFCARWIWLDGAPRSGSAQSSAVYNHQA